MNSYQVPFDTLSRLEIMFLPTIFEYAFQELADLLYKAAKEEGLLDPVKVEEILKVPDHE